MQSNGEATNSPSPSFNSFFNTNLAEAVARVTAEFPSPSDDEIRSQDPEDDDDFEFNLLVPTDGEVWPVYPVFDRHLLRDFDLEPTSAEIQLKNLFLEGRDGDPPSSSSSEEDEIPDGTYCVWTPEMCTKSNSTGSASALTEKVKAWKLRDLLKRSKSDGKDQSRLIVLTPRKKEETPAGRASSAAGSVGRAAAAGEGNFSRRSREANKRRTYLPYRQDLVGFNSLLPPKAFRKMNLLPFS